MTSNRARLRGRVIRAGDLNSNSSGFKSPSDHRLDLSWVSITGYDFSTRKIRLNAYLYQAWYWSHQFLTLWTKTGKLINEQQLHTKPVFIKLCRKLTRTLESCSKLLLILEFSQDFLNCIHDTKWNTSLENQFSFNLGLSNTAYRLHVISCICVFVYD